MQLHADMVGIAHRGVHLSREGSIHPAGQTDPRSNHPGLIGPGVHLSRGSNYPGGPIILRHRERATAMRPEARASFPHHVRSWRENCNRHETIHELDLELVQACKREEEKTRVTDEVGVLNDNVMKEKERYSLLWRMNCEQLARYDKEIALKYDELMALQKRVETLEARPTRESSGESGTGDNGVVGVTGHAESAMPGEAVMPVPDLGLNRIHSLPFTPTREKEGGV